MNKAFFLNTAFFLLTFFSCILLCAGCAAQRDAGQDAKYTLEELDNLARLEIYLPGESKPAKTIKDKEILYQFNHCSSSCNSDPDSDSEEHQRELEKAASGAAEKYHIVSYKYPVSRFHQKKPEKNMTVTLYEDALNGINIVKTEVAEESIKGADIPGEYLTFYSEIPEEEKAFYQSLAEE